jgi:hypothetical protein
MHRHIVPRSRSQQGRERMSGPMCGQVLRGQCQGQREDAGRGAGKGWRWWRGNVWWNVDLGAYMSVVRLVMMQNTKTCMIYIWIWIHLPGTIQVILERRSSGRTGHVVCRTLRGMRGELVYKLKSTPCRCLLSCSGRCPEWTASSRR